jgi:hypothetical protein
MITSTVNLDLGVLLDSSHGAAAFESQLKKEYSEENLSFWQGVKEFKKLPSDAERYKKAQEMQEEFVNEGSMRQVNLPSKVQRELLDGLGKASDAACPEALFDIASEEIFKLMEKDTFARFKSDPNAISHLVDGFYKTAVKEGRGNVTYEAFRAWAVNEPSLLVVFTGLCLSVQKMLNEARASTTTPESVMQSL